jgi:hypothetical protein
MNSIYLRNAFSACTIQKMMTQFQVGMSWIVREHLSKDLGESFVVISLKPCSDSHGVLNSDSRTFATDNPASLSRWFFLG